MMTISAAPVETTIRRKVTASGVIWVDGRAYYISRRLSGRTVSVNLSGGKLVVDTSVPLRKEYPLPGPAASTGLRRPRAPTLARQVS